MRRRPPMGKRATSSGSSSCKRSTRCAARIARCRSRSRAGPGRSFWASRASVIASAGRLRSKSRQSTRCQYLVAIAGIILHFEESRTVDKRTVRLALSQFQQRAAQSCGGVTQVVGKESVVFLAGAFDSRRTRHPCWPDLIAPRRRRYQTCRAGSHGRIRRGRHESFRVRGRDNPARDGPFPLRAGRPASPGQSSYLSSAVSNPPFER